MLAAIILIGAVASGVVAAAKNRNVIGWAALGACFPLISLIIIACQSPLPPAPAPALPPSRQV